MYEVGNRLTFEQIKNSGDVIVEFLKHCKGFRTKGWVSSRYEEVLLETGGIRDFDNYDNIWTAYSIPNENN